MTQYPEIVEALLKPEAYQGAPSKIELMQTQMSFIFLTGEYVYKIKKPVNLGYLDYTTLNKRKHLCQKEVDLNRRLCPEIYLGVLPITRDHGMIRINGKGKILEYTVKMRYLPQEKMLNVLLNKKQVTKGMMQQLADKLADFHSRAETNPYISTFGSLDAVRVNTEENFSQTEKYIGDTISAQTYEKIKRYTNDFISQKYRLFNERIAAGKIRDCHGDLHAAHICFMDTICIYDCIEFNDRFRYCDTASEIAFLAMDLDKYDRSDLSESFVESYVESSGDTGLMKLLYFYKCYRAYVRGKVECFRMDDPYISETEKIKTKDSAIKYFKLAESYI